MIVRQFLQWMRTAPALDRADGTAALARAFLYSDLSDDDRAVAEGAMLVMLDDSSPLVREALAEALCAHEDAPPAIIDALLGDQPHIAAIILESSPLFDDADLVDIVASGTSPAQCAVARRYELQRAVAAAIAEVGSAESCLELIENETADIAAFSLSRMATRHGHLSAIREALFAREDLPAAAHQALVAKLSETLASFVSGRAWLDKDRARSVAREACEKATITLASETAPLDVAPLIRHLRATGQLTAGLLLRALLSGNITLFEQALADLSQMPLQRVTGLVHGRSSGGFRALYERAGLPLSAYPAFREAISAMQDDGFYMDGRGTARLKRRMTERVLARCEHAALSGIEPLLSLLRRFATEAAREEARAMCEDLVSDDFISVSNAFIADRDDFVAVPEPVVAVSQYDDSALFGDDARVLHAIDYDAAGYNAIDFDAIGQEASNDDGSDAEANTIDVSDDDGFGALVIEDARRVAA
jgi:uncharacterized protein (DUF2336 family)